jgi:uncharacterized protein YecE (DUF72 family)
MQGVRVGTSGWSYPSGEGTWNGLFYPASRSKRAGTAGFDELRFYAEHFDTVEVNSTFYGQPRAEVTSGWANRTPAGFEFSLKLYQKFTHPKMFREAALRGAPGAQGAMLDLLAEVTQADIDEFRQGVEPLARAGKLGMVLAQFPPSFKATPASSGYLDQLLRAFAGYPLAVELRHRSWSEAFGDTLALLNAHQAALVQIDEPQFTLSIEQNRLPNITGAYYMRLHGRNAAQWWQHAHRDDRYNYLYSANELREFSDAAGGARTLVKKAYLYTNNHFSAKSVVNAVMLKAQLGEPVTGEFPQELVERYPEIAELVRTGHATPVGVPRPLI